MSSDSGQWQAPTPGSLFLVEIGDYTHVLRPADQKSADNLRLAQQAEANINMARVLFPQNRDFLLAEKQIKMDEVISDAEEAINRVIKLLEPSRVEHITEECVRFNTRSPWALMDDHKSAATFGRLQITHNKLKTVLHDLRNIEATAQLDSCETRVNAVIDSGVSSKEVPHRPASKGVQDPAQLLAWRRSQRARSVGSHGSSTISLLSPNDFAPGTLGSLSGVTPSGTLLTNAIGSAPHFSEADYDNAQQHFVGSDNMSEASAERLPVIHELEAVLYGSPTAPSEDKQESEPRELQNEVRSEEDHPNPAGGVSRINIKSTNTSSNVSSMGTPSARRKKTNHIKMDSFTEYRRKIKEERRHQEQKHEPKAEITSVIMPSPLLESPAQPTEQHEHNKPLSLPPAPAHSVLARSGDSQIASGLHQDSLGSQTAPIAGVSKTNTQLPGPSVQQRPASVAGAIWLGGQHMHYNSEHISRSAMPPRLVSTSEIQRRREQSTEQELISKGPFAPAHLGSPDRPQQSSLEQFRSPVSTLSEPPHPSNAQVRTRLPTILRTAQPKKLELGANASLPYPVSEADSDHGDEFPTADLSKLRQIQSAVDHPITAPPRPVPMPRTTYPPPQATHHIPDPIHHRSTSGASVPEISVTRVHTISRKALPNRSAVVSPTASSNLQQAGSPYPTQEWRQPLVLPLTNGIHKPQNVPHGPPSPAVSEDDRKQDHFEHNHQRTPSVQHLEATASEASRRSSVSAEEPSHAPPAPQSRLPVTNPLAMHPPPASVEYLRQNQPVPTTKSEPQKQWHPAQQDYSSPAWQQARHFYPVFQQQVQQPMRPLQQHSPHLPPGQPLQPYPPVRTQTAPYPTSHESAFIEEDQQPRRASEQGHLDAHRRPFNPYGQPHAPNQAPFTHRPPDNFVPVQPLDPPPPPPLNQLQYPRQPYPNHHQQQQPPLGNASMSNPRIQTAILAPLGSIDQSGSLPLPNGAGTVGQNAPRKPSKDRELFGRQIFRYENEKKSSPQQAPPTQPQLQPQPPLEKRIPNPINNAWPPQQAPIPTQSSPKPQSLLEQQFTNPASNRHASAEAPLDIPPAHFQQQNQWQYSMHQNRLLDPIAEPHEQRVPDRTQTPASKPKKRQSWLAHHANKLSAKQSQPSIATTLRPIVDQEQGLRTQESAERIRYA